MALKGQLGQHGHDCVQEGSCIPLADQQLANRHPAPALGGFLLAYADELLRVLRPGGLLAVADWNRRDPSDGPMGRFERWVMRQLLEQWAHPEFASIHSLQAHLQGSDWAGGIEICTDDWSGATLPSWIDSILEGIRRPLAVLGLGPRAVLLGLRETPTLLLMHWGFASGMMQFGVFRARKPSP